MARGDWLSRSGLILGGLVAFLVVVVLIGWLRGPGPAASAGPGKLPDRSPPGWEVRYSASVALARRGSDNVRECFDVFKEMLDEDQQLANFRVHKDNKEVTDELAARETVVNALRALEELHRKRPDLDLADLHPAVEKLRGSPNLVLRTEAERALINLRNK